MTTQFTVRAAGASTTFWDPTSYPAVGGCTQTYPGYNLSDVATLPLATYNVFRRWAPLCTMTSAPAGQYMIQVKTNGLGTDAASGHNRFGLRAFSSTDTTAKDSISIAGFSKMAIYANLPSARTTFFLARVPSTAAGQVLNVKLFDIGDSTGSGSVAILSPSGGALTGCVGSGPRHVAAELQVHGVELVQRQVAGHLGPDRHRLQLRRLRPQCLLVQAAVRLRQRQPAL